jgi:hypothetical protein
MRRGSRAPSMMFHIEAAAAVVAEVDATFFAQNNPTSRNHERCEAAIRTLEDEKSYIIETPSRNQQQQYTSEQQQQQQQQEQLLPKSKNSKERRQHQREGSYTTLLGLQLQQSLTFRHQKKSSSP